MKLSLSYRNEIRRARARIATGSKMLKTAVGPIEYAEAGEGPPVLVIHGAGGGFDQGLDIGEGFLQRGFRVIAPSRFGYLRTPLSKKWARADVLACSTTEWSCRPCPALSSSGWKRPRSSSPRFVILSEARRRRA